MRLLLDGMIENLPIVQRYFGVGDGPPQIGCHVNDSGQFTQTLRGVLNELRISSGIAAAPELLSYHYAPAAEDLDEDGVPDDWVVMCPGDFDGDGTVGGSDLGGLLRELGASRSGLSTDLNGDAVINRGDLGLLFSPWGDYGGAG